MATDGGAGHLSPDGSPQASAHGSLVGQALDGAEIARRMMQAAETAAQAASATASAVEFFRLKVEVAVQGVQTGSNRCPNPMCLSPRTTTRRLQCGVNGGGRPLSACAHWTASMRQRSSTVHRDPHHGVPGSWANG